MSREPPAVALCRQIDVQSTNWINAGPASKHMTFPRIVRWSSVSACAMEVLISIVNIVQMLYKCFVFPGQVFNWAGFQICKPYEHNFQSIYSL